MTTPDASAAPQPQVPQVEFAAFDAMKEVASSLKAAYFRRSMETDNRLEIEYWNAQEDFVDNSIKSVDDTNLEEILSTTDFFARLLSQLKAQTRAA